jgi:hypothetical protein
MRTFAHIAAAAATVTLTLTGYYANSPEFTRNLNRAWIRFTTGR